MQDNVYDRLFAAGKEMRERKALRDQAKPPECTFHPKVAELIRRETPENLCVGHRGTKALSMYSDYRCQFPCISIVVYIDACDHV